MEKFLRFSLLFFFSFVFLSSLSLGDEMGQEKEGERIGTVLPLAFFVLCFSSFFLLRILHEKVWSVPIFFVFPLHLLIPSLKE